MIEEYDIIYIQNEDIELFLMQYPHIQSKENDTTSLDTDFMKLKEVQLKP